MDGDVHGHSSENDYFGSFPSVHSGSWSALMQEAVQASTSDKGVQEEWSGLSYQKTEQQMLKPLITTTDSGKQPAIWDHSNLKGASSTSRPFPLFNDANTTPTSTDAINQHSFDSTYEESSRVLTEAPRASSFRGSSNREFHQNRKFVEGSLQAQMPSSSRAWAGLTIKQHENSSEEIQFKPQGTEDGWNNQQNMTSSNVSVLPVNKLNNLKASFPMASGGDKSNHHESDGNLWEFGENHVNMNSGLQRVKSDIGSLNIQAEESLAGKFVSVNKPNTLKLSQDMHHQVTNAQQTVFGGHFALNSCVHSEDDKDIEENQNQPSRKQTWEMSVSTAAERLGKSYEKKKEHERVVLGDSYAGIAAKEKYLLTANDQYPSWEQRDCSLEVPYLSAPLAVLSMDQLLNIPIMKWLLKQAAADVSITHPHFDQSSNLRGFGLRLALPSQGQPLPNHAPISQKSLNDINSGQSDHEAEYQGQAWLSPTSSIRPSIINHGRDTSSWGVPKPGDQVKKEDSAPPEHMDVSHESSNTSQGKEAVLKPQQDVNKTRNGQDQALSSCVLRAPLTNNVSTSSGLLAGRMSKPSDVQQQNYSLFHQVQSMKASESDINKMTGSLPKGAAFSSDNSQMNFNVDQGIVHGQNAIPIIPADGKVGAASHISFTSDAKLLSFTSSDSEEQNPNTSSAGHHIQSHMEPLSTSSTANVLGDVLKYESFCSMPELDWAQAANRLIEKVCISYQFGRLERKTSLLDVRLECQELERFSIVNRLGKFHGRTHADGIDVSSTPGNAYRRIFPQRYITALPVPGNLPDGVCCLSL
ncbi:hypothetical protein B296_00014446 [Ensete ventricosum]|uniref:Uncharacterized protein n=1 Tax=Ensete ventricosum TaxID=4639 RepID=A0A427AGT4_ENSVE|nr:hypothetical protein B296_00014446 [Ensete ventricosum]